MTNQEFLIKLNEKFDKYPVIKLSKQKSLNELVYVLRMSENDYQINLTDPKKPNELGMIPSVKETFIPSRDLIRTVASVSLDEEVFNEYGIYLLDVVLK